MPSEKIQELLVPSAICLQLAAVDSKQVLETLAGRLYQAGFVHESFTDAALQREAQMPTGLPLEVNTTLPSRTPISST